MIKNKKETTIKSLYSSIHKCTICCGATGCNIKSDKNKVERKYFEHILESEVFVVAQSLAEKQIRLSGIPYHYCNMKMSNGGKFIEKYFNKLSYTLDPNNNEMKLVYTTDVIQCFPGRRKKGSGDNTPTINEINNCKKWFLQEYNLIKPKVILLFGLSATKVFIKTFLKIDVYNLKDYYLQKFVFDKTPVYCLPHPTSMVKNKSEIYENTFQLVKNIID